MLAYQNFHIYMYMEVHHTSGDAVSRTAHMLLLRWYTPLLIVYAPWVNTNHVVMVSYIAWSSVCG